MPALTFTEMLGANLIDQNTVDVRVWAPNAKQLRVLMVGATEAIPMRRQNDGTWALQANARAGDQYFVAIDDNKPVPDPVSRYLPQGIHGPTEIVDPEAYQWHDHNWRGLPLEQYVIYELHTGTFSPSGTFDGVIEKLSYLRELGVTAI